ncbi:MAG: hypothetical protein JNG90_18495 [Planctomycetaceae bacterium]|nr:hypothetical protein [Planctomycetaceae bacterium]
MIEFRCRSCQSLLQVADDLVGRQARCPACAKVNIVPSRPTSPGAGEPSPAEPGKGAASGDFAATLPYSGSVAGPGNPYRYTAASAEPDIPWSPRTLRPTPILVGDVLVQTWQIFRDHLGSVVGASLVVYLLDAVCGALVNSLYHGAVNSTSSSLATFLIWGITFVAGTAFSIWVTAGLMLYLLRIARNEPVHFGQLFEAGHLVWPAAIASVAYTIVVTLGLIACIVPGIMLGLMYFPVLPLVIDARLPVAEAFRTSKQVTANNLLAVGGIWLISVGLAAVGALTCGIGLLATMPFVALLQAVTYLAITGQPIPAAKG